MRLLAGLPVGGGERDFEGITGRERNGARESSLGSQTASCVSSCEDRLVVNGKAYLSFTLPPTPAPLPWTVNVASSKLQPAARTAELYEMAAKAALRRSLMVCVIGRDARKKSGCDLTSSSGTHWSSYVACSGATLRPEQHVHLADCSPPAGLAGSLGTSLGPGASVGALCLPQA